MWHDLFRAGTRQPSRSHRQRRTSLVLETLEDRLAPAAYTLNSSADTNVRDNQLTLREALLVITGSLPQQSLTAAEQAQVDRRFPGNMITFDSTAFPRGTVITLASPLPDLSSNLAIFGPGSDSLTITDGGASFRLLVIPAHQNATLTGITFSGSLGGAIANYGALNVDHCNFEQNAAEVGSALYNGGGTAQLVHCVIANNHSTSLGVVSNQGGNLQVQSCTFQDNSSDFDGALNTTGGFLQVIRSTFRGNHQGAVTVWQAQANFLDCTFVDNHNDYWGGALWSGGAQSNTTLVNCTVVRNEADHNSDGQGAGGGIAAAGPVTLVNTIVAGNVRGPGALADDIDGSIADSSNHNFIGVGTAALGIQNGISGNQVGTPDRPLDPRLGPLQNNGGATWTCSPLPGSPVIDAGNSSDIRLTTDQRNDPRLADANGDGVATVDIGAYEVQAYVVNTLSDNLPDNDDIHMSLREAMTLANSQPGTAAINFAPTLAGMIALQYPYLQFLDDTIVNGPGADTLTIDGGNTYRIFYVDTNVSVTLFGLTLDHGFGLGGSLYVNFGHVTMTDCVVADNCSNPSAYFGAIIQSHGTMDLEHCTFRQNNAYGVGGVMSCYYGTTTVRNCTFSANTSGSVGGAFYNQGDALVVTGSTFSDNQCDYGAVLYDYLGSTSFTDCAFTNTGSGANLFEFGGQLTLTHCSISDTVMSGSEVKVVSGATAAVEDCTFQGISTSSSDGILTNVNGTLTVSGSLFTGNHGISIKSHGATTITDSTIAENSGVGIWSDGGPLTVMNATVVRNQFATGDSAVIIKGGTAVLYNTIVADNASTSSMGAVRNDISGSVASSSSHNFVGVDTGLRGIANGVNGNRIGTASEPLEPFLGPLQDNGGPTWTCAPELFSPVLDAGDNTHTSAMDQRGLARLADADGDGVGQVDIGAYEVQAYLVNSLGDNPPDSDDAHTSLREAMTLANAEPGIAAINFAPGLTGTITLQHDRLAFLDDTIVNGPGAGVLAISGGDVFGLFQVEGTQVSLSGLTLTHGHATRGSALYNDHGNVIVRDMVMRNNWSASLGVVTNLGGGLSVQRSTFRDNASTFDGALDTTGGLLFVNASTFTGNRQGAVTVWQAEATFVNCTFTGNRNDYWGGAVWSGGQGSRTLMVHCTVVGNQADHDGDGQGAGGGIAAAGTVLLFNTIVARNVSGSIRQADDIDGRIDGQSGNDLIGIGIDTLGIQDGVNGNQVGTVLHPVHPRVGPLQDNGGPTWTMALLSGSPAIDSGSSAIATLTDERGLARPVGGAVDIGAYEDQLGYTPPAPQSVDENTSTAIDLGFLTDADPGASSWSVTVNWGDGGSELHTRSSAGPLGTAAHAYADGSHTYIVRVSATDNHGGTATGAFVVRVDNVSPTLTFSGPDTGVPGESLPFTYQVSDPSVVDTSSGFALSIDWGDGTTDAMTPVWHGAISHPYAATGHYLIQGIATDKDGGRSITSRQDVTINRLVTGFVVNDGNAQRSMVNSLTITFGTLVTLGDGAIEVDRQGVRMAGIMVTTTAIGGHTVATIAFTGAGIIGGSLGDGRYTLAVHASQVFDAFGQPLDGVGHGDADHVEQFFRLYGDATGDGKVDNLDLAYLRNAFDQRAGQAGYLWFLDYNQDGVIDRDMEYAQFKLRYGRHV